MAVKVDSESRKSVAALRKSRVAIANTPSYTLSRFLRSQSPPPGVSSRSFSCTARGASVSRAPRARTGETRLANISLDGRKVAKHEVHAHEAEHQVHLLAERNRLRRCGPRRG